MSLKQIVAFIGLSATGLMPMTALAQDFYAGLNVSHLTYSNPSSTADTSFQSVGLRFGVEFDEHFAGEMRVSGGVNKGGLEEFGSDGEMLYDYFYGAFVRAGVKYDSALPYVVLGHSGSKITTEFSTKESYDIGSFAYGAGVDVHIGGPLSLNLEYMSYFSDSFHGKIDGFSIGLTTSF